MPVIPPKDGIEPWLSGSDPAADPDIDAAVQITPVSPKMDKPSYRVALSRSWLNSIRYKFNIGSGKSCDLAAYPLS
jgi:hypothetical protein